LQFDRGITDKRKINNGVGNIITYQHADTFVAGD